MFKKSSGSKSGSERSIPREALPIADRAYVGEVTLDARDPNTHFPSIQPLLPPKGAPNVLIVLIDDVGFGASSAFGGPCETPNFEKLAKKGLRYTRFHTAALCSPTRAALLTGRNHHSVGMGGITEIATSAPGYNSLRPNSKAPLAEILKLNGYSTSQFGKCHEVPVWQTSPMGPFDHWPTGGGGFEHFYGFIGGETNQWDPALYEGTTPVDPPNDPDYHLTEDLSNRAISWVRQQKALMPDKPFFMYFAPGATHAPHHVPKEWVERYRGKFDRGWDRLREETFKRQKKLGVIPKDADLTRRHEEISAWDSIDPKLRPVLAREMEIYAGFLSHTDHHVGKLISALEDLEILDDTLIYVIIGDNGASAEGGPYGSFNESLGFNDMTDIETPEFLIRNIDEFGGPNAFNHYAVGWAHAMCTPYQWTKQIASHWGGTRNGTIVHWPNGIRAKGEHRHQFTHVIDVAPTILEAAGLPEPTSVHGVTQSPMEGISMLYSFDGERAPERHEVQYFEMFGNRGIYYKGWSAITKHRTPWEQSATRTLAQDVWELYDGSKDWTQAHDLAERMPEKLDELQQKFVLEAARYNVFPLDDRSGERFNSDLAGRPTLIRGKSELLFAGMGRLSENTVINVKNKSFAVTAEIEVPRDQLAQGVLLAQGGRFGGWSFYLKDGKAKFVYNLAGVKRFPIESKDKVPSGKHQLRSEFAYDGGGVGKGGTLSLYCDGKKIGEGRVDRTQAFVFSADETADVGRESGTSVSDDYDRGSSQFNGKIHWLQIDTGKDDQDHLITPEERLRVAMARQ